MDRDSLFNSTPTRQRGFKRLRQPWSHVKEWKLDQYEREVVHEEIRTIMGHSLDEAGSKTFIRPNANSIAGWRVKQVTCFFLFIFFCDINSLFCIAEFCVTQGNLDAQYLYLSI